MNKKYLATATLVALAGLYLGCTNPSTVVDTAKTTADPRVPAGNATSTTFSKTNVTGYWTVKSTDPYGYSYGHLALKQNSDGTIVGQGPINDFPLTSGSNANGALTFVTKYGSDAPRSWAGTVSDDGVSVTITWTNPGSNATMSYDCTRLF